MAADSAVTNQKGDVVHYTRKLHKIPRLSAGISHYGISMLDEKTPIDKWLADFTDEMANKDASRRTFASTLRDELNKREPRITDTLGLHIAGFEEAQDGKKYPSFDRILGNGQFTLETEPPHKYPIGCRILKSDPKNIIYDDRAFNQFLKSLKSKSIAGGKPFQMPDPDSLRMRAEYLRFQIVTISHLYTLSNQPKLIGGPVTTLSISEDDFQDYETRAEILCF